MANSGTFPENTKPCKSKRVQCNCMPLDARSTRTLWDCRPASQTKTISDLWPVCPLLWQSWTETKQNGFHQDHGHRWAVLCAVRVHVFCFVFFLTILLCHIAKRQISILCTFNGQHSFSYGIIGTHVNFHIWKQIDMFCFPRLNEHCTWISH